MPADRAPIISATLIVRDEHDFLDGCLASLDGFADEVVVVDTGSVDDSVAIARRHGAAVSHLAWTGDFAVARNHAMHLATGDWLLYIDADERVQPTSRSSLDPILLVPAVVGARVAFRPVTGMTRYRELRLVRNHPDIRFEGEIHENLWPSVQRLIDRDGALVADVDVAIDHLGYDGDQTAKHARNLPLLRSRLAADPTHVYSWHHLGRVLVALGDVEDGEQAWANGVEAVLAAEHPTPTDWLVFESLIEARAARGEPVDDLLTIAIERFGTTPAIRITRARLAVAGGDYAAAIDDLTPLVAIDVDTFVSDGLSLDERWFGELGWGLLATAHFELGDYDAAAEAFDRAYEHQPSTELMAKRTVARARARTAARR
jgi:hypothetical protein